jgi:hypothetical protein
VALAVAAPDASAQTLRHRYTFNGNANDSVGGANATLRDGAVTTDGRAFLDGLSSYVELPATTINLSGSTYSSGMTLETWVSTTNVNFRWTAAAMFGTEGPTDSVGSYVMMQTVREPVGQGSRVAISNSGRLGERGITDGARDLNDGLPRHLVMTLTYPNTFGNPGTVNYYLDGALVGTTTNNVTRASLVTPSAYLGRSLFAGDPLLQGAIHEFSIYSGVMNATTVGTNFTNGPAGGLTIGPRVEVNRASGAMRLVTDTLSPTLVSAYTVASTAGAINSANWASIANTGDADSGGSFDPSNVWGIADQLDTQIREEAFGAGSSFGSTTPRGIGKGVWRRSRFENLTANITTTDGLLLGVPVTYVGGPAISRSDFNADGVLNAADYTILRTNFQTVLSGTSQYANWLLGDVDGDGLSTFTDYRLFQIDYTAANGAAAFAQLGVIPEPASCLLAASVLAACPSRRRR